MPHFIVKIDPELDFYVDWSTVVDAPVGWGTRAEFEAEPEQSSLSNPVGERLDRADRTGSSDRMGWYAWDKKTTFILANHGEEMRTVERADIPAFVASYDNPAFPEGWDTSLTPVLQED